MAAINHREQADALTEDSNRRQSPLHKLQQSTIVNKSKPSPRSTPADNQHCTRSSNHRKKHRCPLQREHQSQQSPLPEWQQYPPSQTCRCPQRGAHQPTITTALTAAVATIARKTDASQPMITTVQAATTIANTQMPRTRRTPADDHYWTSGSNINHRERADALTKLSNS